MPNENGKAQTAAIAAPTKQTELSPRQMLPEAPVN